MTIGILVRAVGSVRRACCARGHAQHDSKAHCRRRSCRCKRPVLCFLRLGLRLPLGTACLRGGHAVGPRRRPAGDVWPTCKNVSRHAIVREMQQKNLGRVRPTSENGGRTFRFRNPRCKNLCLEPSGNEMVKKQNDNRSGRPAKVVVRHSCFATRDAKTAGRPVKMVGRHSGFAA